MANQQKIKEFFDKNIVTYEVKKGKITVNLQLQMREPSGWKHGIDYLCYADLKVTWESGICSKNVERPPSVVWSPGYLHVDSRAPKRFGGLFSKANSYSAMFEEMLHAISLSPNINEIRRALYDLEDKVQEDFSGEEFEKHFERRDSS